MRSSVSADYVYDMGMVIRSSRAAALDERITIPIS